jgi:polar amino acid transport system permease protein
MFRFDLVLGDFGYVLWGVPLTLGITFAAFAIGTLMGLPIALIRIARVPLLNALVLAWVEFFRTTPPIVHIIWGYYVLPVAFNLRFSAFTIVAGALAFSTSAIMAEIFRGGILAVPKGQWAAATVLGLTLPQKLHHIVLPQTLRLILAPSCNTLVSLLKQSSLAALIAVPEIMGRGQILATETFRPIEVLTLVGVLYFVVTYPLVLVVASLERRSRVAFQTG